MWTSKFLDLSKGIIQSSDKKPDVQVRESIVSDRNYIAYINIWYS